MWSLTSLASSTNRNALPVRGRRVLLLGLAYKRNTGDARESPSRTVAEQLLALGAKVCIADDHVRDEQIPAGAERVTCTAEELAGADAVVLLVDHDHFDRNLVQEHARYVLDTRAVLPAGPNVERL